MSKIKPTQGPWSFGFPRARPGVIRGDIRVQSSSGEYVATIRRGVTPHISDEQHEANARMIAAAPDMRSVSARLCQWDIDFPVNCHDGYAGLKELNRIVADARAAIAKVEGSSDCELEFR